MKIILIQDVAGTGRKGEVKDVRDGYARNFLIPNKKAEFGSPTAIKRAEVAKASLVAEKQIRESLAQKSFEMLKEARLVLKAKTNDKGHLFSAVHATEISKAIKERVKVELPSEFLKIEKPIKEIGSHKIKAVIGDLEREFEITIEAL